MRKKLVAVFVLLLLVYKAVQFACYKNPKKISIATWNAKSYTDYGIIVPPATEWKHLFDTDEKRFGGQGLVRRGGTYLPSLVLDERHGELVQQIKAYLPARTAIVLKKIRHRKNG